MGLNFRLVSCLKLLTDVPFPSLFSIYRVPLNVLVRIPRGMRTAGWESLE